MNIKSIYQRRHQKIIITINDDETIIKRFRDHCLKIDRENAAAIVSLKILVE